MSRLRIAVVVPTFERAERLERLVKALEAQTLPHDEWEAIAVDDCSTDDTALVLQELCHGTHINLTVRRTPRRGGPALARNVGWRATDAPVVAFTDDDCVPSPDWLRLGLAAITSDPKIGITQGQTTRAALPPGEVLPMRVVVREVLKPSPWFEGCNLFVRRTALEASGGFDERIAWMGEETSMAWSILDRGWHRGWAPDAVVVHDIEERSLRVHLRNRYMEGHAVRIAARHPSLREMWWRPWALEKRGATFALAVAGISVATRRRSALVLTLPYVLDLLPLGSWPPSRRDVTGAAFRLVSDAASLTGKLVESARWRMLVV